jgi:hypothetical protein
MPELPFLYWPMPHIDSITGYLENGLPISCFVPVHRAQIAIAPQHRESDHTTNAKDHQRGQ